MRKVICGSQKFGQSSLQQQRQRGGGSPPPRAPSAERRRSVGKRTSTHEASHKSCRFSRLRTNLTSKYCRQTLPKAGRPMGRSAGTGETQAKKFAFNCVRVTLIPNPINHLRHTMLTMISNIVRL